MHMLAVYPELATVRSKYIKNELPMVIGPLSVNTHVRVASLWWGGMYDVYVPNDAKPREFVECYGSKPCQHRPL